MYAELALDHKLARKIIEKKALEPAQKRLIVSDISQEAEFSIERACRVLRLSTCVFYYKSIKDDMPVVDMLNELAGEHPTGGAIGIMAVRRAAICGTEACPGIANGCFESIGVWISN